MQSAQNEDLFVFSKWYLRLLRLVLPAGLQANVQSLENLKSSPQGIGADRGCQDLENHKY